jgi:hypothetical protein
MEELDRITLHEGEQTSYIRRKGTIYSISLRTVERALRCYANKYLPLMMYRKVENSLWKTTILSLIK